MTVSIKVKGVGEVINNLKSTDKQIFNKADKAIFIAGLFVESEVKESIAGRRAEPRSVDTGRFLNSPTTRKIGKLKAEVSSNVEYAGDLEYGTSKMSPRSHFRNSAARSKRKVIQIIKEKLNL